MISEISKIICKQDHYSPSLSLSLSPLPPPLSPSLSLIYKESWACSEARIVFVEP